MNAILLKNLQEGFVIEEHLSMTLHDPVSRTNQQCLYYKLKHNQPTSFVDATGLENGVRYYVEMNGYVNYLSENLAKIWVKEVMKKEQPIKGKRNFGK